MKQQLAHLKSYICFVETNADLDAEIQAALRKIRATINLIHIKGHQDDEKGFDYDNALLSVRTNIDMDEEAKRIYRNIKDDSIQHTSFHSNQLQVLP